ncbi:MAG: capsule assembly Wzi family protein [Ignavibacteria bacterium]
MNKIKLPFILHCLIFTSIIFTSSQLYSQVEMVPPSDKIYDFLDRMSVNKIIDNYSSSMLPISRREISKYLITINVKRGKISRTDKKILDDYLVEYEYDIQRTLKNSSSFFSDFKFSDIFRDKKQKYLFSKADSNVSFFWDAIGEMKYFGAKGDSLGKPHLSTGLLGTRLRGTLFNSVGFYLRLSNGVRLGGTQEDAITASHFDPVLASTRKFISEGSKTFDSFEGYLRYATSSDWLGLTVGREALKFGTGFIDQLIISNNNSAPYDYIKLDLSYKKIRYTFFHSNLVGNDSLGKQLSSKYLVFHRLEFGPLFNGVMKFSFNEMLLYSGVPINLAFINPISFLTSADLNTESPQKNTNNSIIALDAQFYPVKHLTVQGTFLIDDINFNTLGKNDVTSNDNKFAYQAGLEWQDAFKISNFNFTYEYTRIDPFVYTHRENSNYYANWGLPIGHSLPPNSDEHAVKISYFAGSRLNLALTFKHQRSGENLTDSIGNVLINYGSNILHGENDFVIKNIFLNGLRVDRNIFIAEITWQPIRQYFLSIKYQYEAVDNIFQNNRKLSDSIFWGTFRVDY